jgi:Tfp pilus assembly protein PilN
MIPSGLRKWAAFGTGVGIEIDRRDLIVTVVRVRPSGIAVLGMLTIPGFEDRPAAEWGAVYADFLKKTGASHVAAWVVPRRRDVIVRQVAVPGVAERDLAGAVALQMDSLHPYPEDGVRSGWGRLGDSGAVLVAIARDEVVDRYATLFSEAGIKLACFTVSAAAIYSALRIYGDPEPGWAAVEERGADIEVYGESASKPVYSAAFAGSPEQAGSVALAELRLPAGTGVLTLPEALPKPVAAPEEGSRLPFSISYAAALAGACPRLSLPLNLLPEASRTANSRAMWIPTVVLGSLLLLVVIALAISISLQQRNYRERLAAEVARLEIEARKVAQVDREIQTSRARTLQLDELRATPRQSLDAMNELTGLLAPPAWLNSLDLTRTQVSVAGEAEQAAGLLKLIDESPYFRGSEFQLAPARTPGGETFRIRAQREFPVGRPERPAAAPAAPKEAQRAN